MAVLIIQVSGGNVTLVDQADSDLASLNWHLMQKMHVRCNRPDGKKPLLHRVIMSRIIGRELLASERVDHIDGNPLNNVRQNLRLATDTQNAWNTKMRSTNTSGYKGVYWHKARNKWCAWITCQGKRRYLGYFDDIEDAHRAYEDAARKLFGEFYRQPIARCS